MLWINLNNDDFTFREDPNSSHKLEVKTSTFPGGEIFLRLPEKMPSQVTLFSRMNSANDFLQLLMVEDAARRAGATLINAFIPYFPYARQDHFNVGESLSLKVVTELLNRLCFNKIIIYDPHSDVTPALLDDVRVINNHAFLDWVITQLKWDDFILVGADGSSTKRLEKYVNVQRPYPIVGCAKQRNQLTTEITGLHVLGNFFNKKCLIVDDICDGGATFIKPELGVIPQLLKAGASEVALAVSHGIFSKDLLDFDDVSKIFCTNSFRRATPLPERIQVYPLSWNG